jgi:hypothetical protein
MKTKDFVDSCSYDKTFANKKQKKLAAASFFLHDY